MWLGKACGHCSYCINGWETLCESQENSGYSVDGAWAEYAVAFDSHVITVPEAVSSFDAAPLACAGVTSFKAVKVSRIQPGDTAVIFGVGGLGHLALQYARELGGRVIAVDIEDSKLDLARQLGADYVVNARTTDPGRGHPGPRGRRRRDLSRHLVPGVRVDHRVHRGARKDLADVFALHAAGRTKVIAQERHPDDVNLCIEEVLSGQVPARLVFTF